MLQVTIEAWTPLKVELTSLHKALQVDATSMHEPLEVTINPMHKPLQVTITANPVSLEGAFITADGEAFLLSDGSELIVNNNTTTAYGI
jgi:hypothetical protein